MMTTFVPGTPPSRVSLKRGINVEFSLLHVVNAIAASPGTGSISTFTTTLMIRVSSFSYRGCGTSIWMTRREKMNMPMLDVAIVVVVAVAPMNTR